MIAFACEDELQGEDGQILESGDRLAIGDPAVRSLKLSLSLQVELISSGW